MFSVKSAIFLLMLSIAVAVPLLSKADNYTSTNFNVANPVIEELGGYATSTNFRLWGNIPYISPVIGTSTSYSNRPGFLASGTSSIATTSTSTAGGSGAGGTSGPLPEPEPAKTKPPVTGKIKARCDFNKDGKCSFVDFSILLYYFDKTGDRIKLYDLSDDGVVDIVDLSIFMYYWDGS